jgi:hypothetical protein
MPALRKMTDVRARVSDAERETRVNLAAAYRPMPLFSMSDLVYHRITARVPAVDAGTAGPLCTLRPQATPTAPLSRRARDHSAPIRR